MSSFNGRILVMGCGAVAQCALPLLLKHLSIDPSHITVIDFVDKSHRIADPLSKGVNYCIERITKDNYADVLKRYLNPGDLCIDLTTNIDTIALLNWCRTNEVKYINSSVEQWDPYEEVETRNITDLTLYTRQMAINKVIEEWGDNKGATAIVDHGANPGLVSHFTKQALIDIAEKTLLDQKLPAKKQVLEQALMDIDFPRIAQALDVQVIHISERDTQITNKPKEVNEFVNTWSIDGLYEEGIAPAELGWGTHERTLPANAHTHPSGPQNQICLSSRGIHTWAKSWVPSGQIVGRIIRHGEAFGISDRLTVWENQQAQYRPTVHYVYCLSDAAMNSVHEMTMHNLELQKKQRILTDDQIISGRDELGVLLMGHPYRSWWIGSLLDINEARKLVPGQNATTVQVGIGVVAAALYTINHPNEGFNIPDDLDHREIMRIALPYLGPFISQPVDWSPLQTVSTCYTKDKIVRDDEWQFGSFLVRC